MAEVVRVKYKGKDTGEGLPFFAGIPARDLTDEDFDALDADQKEVVKHSAVYDYVPYTEKAREGSRPRRDIPTEPPASVTNTEGEVK